MFSVTLADWLTDIVSGSTGVALGMMLSGIAWYFYQVRVVLPRQDARDKTIQEFKDEIKQSLKGVEDALYWAAKSVSAHLMGSTQHTDAAKEEARKIATTLDRQQNHNDR